MRSVEPQECGSLCAICEISFFTLICHFCAAFCLIAILFRDKLQPFSGFHVRRALKGYRREGTEALPVTPRLDCGYYHIS